MPDGGLSLSQGNPDSNKTYTHLTKRGITVYNDAVLGNARGDNPVGKTGNRGRRGGS